MRLFALVLVMVMCGISAAGQTAAAASADGVEQLEPLCGPCDGRRCAGAADQMVSTGMRDAGYIYVNLDDTWQGERDAKGVLHPNAAFRT